MSNFQYKSKNRVFKEFNECKTVFDKLDYAKKLKKDAYDHVYNCLLYTSPSPRDS